MNCFKCGCPQPTNEKAARLGAIAAVNRINQELEALERGLTRTVAAVTPEDELRMASFEDGWGAAITSLYAKIREVAKEYDETSKTT